MNILRLIVAILLVCCPIQAIADNSLDGRRKAAEQGHASAQYELGYMYLTGSDVTKDYNEAAIWFQKAADQGYVEAQVVLGHVYRSTKDYKEAAIWFKKAANKGHASAQFHLGVILHENGDDVLASEWFTKAADQGYVDAQVNLGTMYYKGEGVPLNKFKTYELYMKAARQGHELAQGYLDILCNESPWACK